MSKIALYPGTFDPITNGHFDIIKRASLIFSKLIIGVIKKPLKSDFFFTVQERIEMIEYQIKDLPNVEIQIFEGLLVNHLNKNNISIVVRGLRAISDFEYEFQMALMNKKLAEKIETVFLMTNEQFSYLSSSLVKEISGYGGDISQFVSPIVEEKLKEKNRLNNVFQTEIR